MTMHVALSVLVLSAALALAEAARGLTPLSAAVVVLAVAVVAAATASRLGPLAIASGALAAVAWVALRPFGAAFAGAAFVALVLCARTIRVLGAPERVAHWSPSRPGSSFWRTGRSS